MLTQVTPPWPTDLFRDVPLGDLPAEWAVRYGSTECLVDGNTRLTFTELAERVDRAASRMIADGITPGEHAIVQLPNTWTLVVTLHALCRVGAIPILMLPTHGLAELEDVAQRTHAVAIFAPAQWQERPTGQIAQDVAKANGARTYISGSASDSLEHLYRESPVASQFPEVDPDAVGLVLLSGGTTAKSKMIARTHNDYEYNIRTCSAFCGIDDQTVYLAALPVSHNFALANPGVIGTLSQGGKAVLIPTPSASRALSAVQSEGVTHSSVVPAVGTTWASSAPELRDSTLRVLHIGGSTLSPHAAEKLEKDLGCEIQQVFGMAEGLICYVPPGTDRQRAWSTQGRPTCEHHQLRVLDPQGEQVPDGEIGELAVRGPHTITGYYLDDTGENEAAFSDGWYLTGDLVRRQPDGFIQVCGRIKDVINRGGEKVAAAEVEAALQRSPRLAKVAVVPVPDPLLGERVCAVVEPVRHLGESITLREARDLCEKAGLASFKAPEHLYVVESLPLTRVGKPDKLAIRELLSVGQQAA